MHYTKLFATLFATAGLMAFIGCSHSTSSVTSFNGTVPSLGSTFIEQSDVSGTVYDTVTTTSMTDAAHPGSIVRAFSVTNNIAPTTIYESYLSDGDLALDGTSGWGPTGRFIVLPFASHTSLTDTFTTATLDTAVITYNGPGAQYSVNNSSYSTDSVTVTVHEYGSPVNYYYTYIPALGLMARSSSNYFSKYLVSYSSK